MTDNEGPTNRSACASCRHQRKKCPESCVMAPHFPAFRADDFLAVHKMFGIANVTKTIRSLDFAQQQDAIKSFVWEANAWVQDGFRGPYGRVRRLEDRIKSLEEERKRQDSVIRNMSERLPSQQWESGVVTNLRHDSGMLMPESSARNVSSSNYFTGVFEEREESGLMGRVHNQGRRFDGINRRNDFDYQNNSSFVQEQERERGGSVGGSGGFGHGRGRGYDGVWGSSVGGGTGQEARAMNQGRVFGQNSNFSSGLPERFRVSGDHGMQDAASLSSSSSSLVVSDYSNYRNNNYLPGN
ncbi:hypothetical protein Vadar_034585 [Vaccinium darrowii]|uniref:Uncharacterized protein n=1 Tax=Vaccinium darrowii TaxID=229202 RepID=A0ACB7XE94_9ERIC|nr:hypothetical protein Vadar_034585 [Vaccinium darrowii]